MRVFHKGAPFRSEEGLLNEVNKSSTAETQGLETEHSLVMEKNTQHVG